MSTSPLLRRREFLGQTVVAGSLALCGAATDVFAAKDKGERRKKKRNKRKRRRSPRVLDIDEDYFEKLVGQPFKVSGAGQHVKFKLVEVREHDHHTDHVRRPIHIRQEPFSLLFIAPNGEKLKSDIYELEHPEIGEMNLFIHEVGADQDVKTVHYEVVFN